VEETMSSQMRPNSMSSHSAANLPLMMVSEGDAVVVSRICGSKELRQHMAAMGFVEGAEVRVVSHVNGDCIVKVKGATFALNRQMTSHILVN